MKSLISEGWVWLFGLLNPLKMCWSFENTAREVSWGLKQRPCVCVRHLYMQLLCACLYLFFLQMVLHLWCCYVNASILPEKQTCVLLFPQRKIIRCHQIGVKFFRCRQCNWSHCQLPSVFESYIMKNVYCLNGKLSFFKFILKQVIL